MTSKALACPSFATVDTTRVMSPPSAPVTLRSSAASGFAVPFAPAVVNRVPAAVPAGANGLPAAPLGVTSVCGVHGMAEFGFDVSGVKVPLDAPPSPTIDTTPVFTVTSGSSSGTCWIAAVAAV
ncbi:hypothetical protein AWB69_08711 [Caballeronia udeis]|uniref:Uncharacterized protein n=1 Tax=Caballeronia udeis TaxID=1232866 RepID=A0A158JSE3_9BURK|nr:hypothetical protein AWB69_08711 [Caballeronia udeis]